MGQALPYLIAERRAGEMLADILIPYRPRKASHDVRLCDLGLNYSQSQRWQLEASVPEEDFLRYIAETRAAGEEMSNSGLTFLWTCGILDIERSLSAGEDESAQAQIHAAGCSFFIPGTLTT